MTQDGSRMDGRCWHCQQALKILEEKAVSDVLDRMRNRRKRFAGLTKLDVDVTQTQTWWPLTGTSMLWRGEMPRWEEGMWLLRLNNILGGRKQLRVGLIEDNGPILWEQRWKKSIILRVCTENLQVPRLDAGPTKLAVLTMGSKFGKTQGQRALHHHPGD